MGKFSTDSIAQSPLSTGHLGGNAFFGWFGSNVVCQYTSSPLFCNMIGFFKLIMVICGILLVFRLI